MAELYCLKATERFEITILPDRSVAAGTTTNSTVEFLLHRRTGRDDWRGVGEPLDDKDPVVSTYHVFLNKNHEQQSYMKRFKPLSWFGPPSSHHPPSFSIQHHDPISELSTPNMESSMPDFQVRPDVKQDEYSCNDGMAVLEEYGMRVFSLQTLLDEDDIESDHISVLLRMQQYRDWTAPDNMMDMKHPMDSEDRGLAKDMLNRLVYCFRNQFQRVEVEDSRGLRVREIHEMSLSGVEDVRVLQNRLRWPIKAKNAGTKAPFGRIRTFRVKIAF
jgi:hypothetical protein